jgi:hypothetical protein
MWCVVSGVQVPNLWELSKLTWYFGFKQQQQKNPHFFLRASIKAIHTGSQFTGKLRQNK